MVTDISEIRILDFQVFFSYCVKLELNRKLKII